MASDQTGSGVAFRLHTGSSWEFRRLAVVVAILLPTVTYADILHLGSGGTVEGEIIKQDSQFVVVRTPVGTITLPADAIQNIEAAPSPFAEYDAYVASTKDTPADQTALANWCEQRGLVNERRKHLLRAIELDPDFAPARQGLGQVRVGPFWVDGRNMVDRRAERQAGSQKEDSEHKLADADERDVQKVALAIQGNWTRRIRAIKQTLLDSNVDRAVRTGRTQLLEIRDPLAILPLTRVLSGGSRPCREILVEALSGFTEDEATMNLAVVSLIDPDESIRDRAIWLLVRRQDPRISAQFRKALGSDNDALLRRAAQGLGAMKDAVAVPDLIGNLTVRRWKVVEVPVRRYFGELPVAFAGATRTVVGSVSVTLGPQIGVVDIGGWAAASTEQQLQNVTVYRTEVLEALKAITGQNFGFDEAAWRRWYEEQKS